MNTEKYINLFCIPSAGSSASIYYNWDKKINDNIKVIPLEYPGHGRKIKEQLINDPDKLAEIFIQEIKSFGDKKFILFGHSVGASLLWRIEEKLKEEEIYNNLSLLIVSSRSTPDYQSSINNYGSMNDDELIHELKIYNNFPDEILDNKSALEFFLKIIKNDFILSDRMINEKIEITKKPLISIYGKDDPYIQHHEIMESWNKYSEKWFGSYALEGNHFYFMNQDILLNTLQIIQSNAEKSLYSQIQESTD